MRSYQIDIDPADVDPDGLADNNASSGATLTLDGALTSGGTFTSADGLGHRLDIIDTATVDQSGATFTITGTDADDNAITEAVTGPGSGATVESTKYFKTVSSVAIASGAACGTVDMGTVDEVESRIYLLDAASTVGAGLGVIVTGTVNYTIEETFRDIHANGTDTDNFVDIAALADKTAELGESATVGAHAIRVVTNSYTNGAELQVDVSQISGK